MGGHSWEPMGGEPSGAHGRGTFGSPRAKGKGTLGPMGGNS